MLLHGIMSSIAEFYSRTLANEVIKGTQQKVQNGGTPTLAPLGYLNVRRVVDGREIRTVDLDPERASTSPGPSAAGLFRQDRDPRRRRTATSGPSRPHRNIRGPPHRDRAEHVG